MLKITGCKMDISRIITCLLFALVLIYAPQLYAQDDIPLVEKKVEISEEVEAPKEKAVVTYSLPKAMKSLFFTYWQHKAIIDAKNSIGLVRAPTRGELDDTGEKEPGLRELSLGGILFRSEDDWTIYLNEQRVKPDAVPKEILGLRVYNDYVEFKWMDEYTNQIFPVRLRSHQRFNLDSRIFLPN